MTISSASQTWTIQFCNPPPTELRKGHKPTMGIAVRVTTQGPPFICARNPSVFVWLHDKASGRRVPELQGTTTQQILSRDADAANGVSFFDDLSILRNGAYELRFQVMYLNAADMLAPGSNILTWHVAVTDTAPVQQTGSHQHAQALRELIPHLSGRLTIDRINQWEQKGAPETH